MRSCLLVAFASAAYASWQPLSNKEVVTEVVSRIHYTCPCDGLSYSVLSTVLLSASLTYNALVSGTRTSSTSDSIGLPTTTTTTSSSTHVLMSTNASGSASGTSAEDPSISTTTGLSSTTQTTTSSTSSTPIVTTTPATTSSTTTSVSSTSSTTDSTTVTTTTTLITTDPTTASTTIITSTASTSTTSAAPVATGDAFIVTVNLAGAASPNLRRRDNSYLTFSASLASFTTDESQSTQLRVTDGGELVVVSNGYPVGSTASTGTNNVEYFSSGSPVQMSDWQLDQTTGLSYPSATFCVTTDGELLMSFDDQPSTCTTVQLVPVAACSDCDLQAVTTSATTTTMTTTSTTTSSSSASAVWDKFSCWKSYPGCTSTSASTSSSSPQYNSTCNHKFGSDTATTAHWAGTFNACMAICDQDATLTTTDQCVGFAYNAGYGICDQTGPNCWTITKATGTPDVLTVQAAPFDALWQMGLLVGS